MEITKQKSKLFAVFLAMILSICAFVLSPGSAFAGGSTGGGSNNGGYNNGGGMFFYVVEDSGGEFVHFDCPGTYYGGKGTIDIQQPSLQEYTNNYSRLIVYACTDYRYGQGNKKHKPEGGQFNQLFLSDTRGGARWETHGNWTAGSQDLEHFVPTELTDSSITYWPVRFDGPIIYRTDTGQVTSSVWVEPNKEDKNKAPKVETTSNSVKRLTHVVQDGKTTLGPYPTYSQGDLEWLYYYGQSEADYYNKTQPNEKTDSFNVSAKLVSIVKESMKVYNDEGEIIGSYTYYYIDGEQQFSKTIDYKLDPPKIEQEKYVPFNLNRNGYATAEDISSDFANAATKLNANIDNKQGVKDNSFLNALDINADIPFTLRFNNTSLGFPDKYNWNNNPPGLANGDYENVSSHYANGKNNGADSDGQFRYSLNMKASISTNRSNSSVDSGSLTIGGDEVTSSKEISKGVGFQGGDWSARFTFSDEYQTDNHDNSKFANWWSSKYMQGRFYEYGTEYSGKITFSGISNPSVKYGTGSIKDSNNYLITTKADNQDQGLYVGYAVKKFEQPIMYGRWKVKTVAGDLN